MKKAIFAGSFDPPTLGHLDIIDRSLSFCDQLLVAIAVNPNKKSLFSDKEKVALLAQSVTDYLGVDKTRKVLITLCDKLLVDLATETESNFLIRGVRTAADFEYEYTLAKVNKHLSPKLQTIFLPANEELSIVSSSVVKELAKYKRDCSDFAPPGVVKALKEKFNYE